jgi:hypothetical protein
MTTPSTPPAPAEQAPQQASTTALDENAIAPTHFIPQATQDNYSQIARDQAGVRGVDPKDVMQELADQFEGLHERQPLDGYDHLAAWARDHDPSTSDSPTGLAILQARALESARRDPYQAVIGDQALVEQGVASQRSLDEGTIGVTSAPTLEGSGMLPNAGPLSVPADTPTTSDPAVAEQQQAAQQQYEQQGDDPAAGARAPAPSGDSSPPEPPPAPKPEPPKGKNSGGSSDG